MSTSKAAINFDQSLPKTYSDFWREAYGQESDTPRLTSYQAPGGEPVVFACDSVSLGGGQNVDTAEYPYGFWSNVRLGEKPHTLRIKGLPTNKGDITKTVSSFSWENESPWAKLLTLADAQDFIITSNQLGGLYIEQPARGTCDWGFAIEEGVNVLHPRRSESGAEQFHEYIVNCCNKVGKATDSTCPNKRKLTINLSEFIIDQEKLDRRAKTEMLRRREDKITCSLSGWGLTEEQIKRLGGTYHKEIFWEVNLLIPVKIPSCNMNANMLISQVEYSADSNSLSCDVTLVKPEAYR